MSQPRSDELGPGIGSPLDGPAAESLDGPAAESLDGAPAESLETARLVVELLHAAYAIRRDDAGTAALSMHGSGPGETHRAGAPLSPHAIRAAIHVYQHRERTVSQLAAGLGISQGWASRVVEELEERGYLVRERDPEDRRIVWVRLSPDAVGSVERAFHWRDDAVSLALAGMASEERAAVRAFLRRLVDELQSGVSSDPMPGRSGP
jgi:DNA-binding MarR family transcriptional regulator